MTAHRNTITITKIPITLTVPSNDRMARRLKLSPLQRDIVMMLEEAGVETVGTVIATLKPPDQGEFAAQVDGLVSLRRGTDLSVSCT